MVKYLFLTYITYNAALLKQRIHLFFLGIFHQKQIHAPSKDGEKEKILVAFHLNHDKTKYISVGTDKRIEISVSPIVHHSDTLYVNIILKITLFISIN